MMKVKYKVTQEDASAFHDAMFLQPFSGGISAELLKLYGLYFLYISPFLIWLLYLEMYYYLGTLFLLLAILHYSIMSRSKNKLITDFQEVPELELEITPLYYFERHNNSWYLRNWQSVDRLSLSNNHLCISYLDHQLRHFYFVPKRAFGSEAEFSAFCELASEYWKTAQNKLDSAPTYLTMSEAEQIQYQLTYQLSLAEINEVTTSPDRPQFAAANPESQEPKGIRRLISYFILVVIIGSLFIGVFDGRADIPKWQSLLTRFTYPMLFFYSILGFILYAKYQAWKARSTLTEPVTTWITETGYYRQFPSTQDFTSWLDVDQLVNLPQGLTLWRFAKNKLILPFLAFADQGAIDDCERFIRQAISQAQASRPQPELVHHPEPIKFAYQPETGNPYQPPQN